METYPSVLLGGLLNPAAAVHTADLRRYVWTREEVKRRKSRSRREECFIVSVSVAGLGDGVTRIAFFIAIIAHTATKTEPLSLESLSVKIGPERRQT